MHMNMRGQTGGGISMECRLIHRKTSKQKMNVKRSMESEFVDVSEYLPYNLLLIMFSEAQGYENKTNFIYQDNKSEIHLEKNEENSCTENSRHIHERFFEDFCANCAPKRWEVHTRTQENG